VCDDCLASAMGVVFYTETSAAVCEGPLRGPRAAFTARLNKQQRALTVPGS